MSLREAAVYGIQYLFLVLVGLRFSWLLIEDDLLSRPRNWISTTTQRKGWQKAYVFFLCPWCIGFWAEVALVAVLDLTGALSFPLVVLWPFAINVVTAPLHYWLDRSLHS